MNSKRLTVWIDEREALPVRAIPIVAGRSFSADVIAESFAHERVSRTPVSYRTSTNGIEPLHHRQWEPTVRQIDALHARIKSKHKKHKSKAERWDLRCVDSRTGAVELLPAGVFVWLDDFEQEYRSNGERGLILTPMSLSATEYAVAMKGFEKYQAIDEREIVASPSKNAEAVTVTILGDTGAYDEKLAALFDLVPVEALEKMFPADSKWKSWADKAASNGLIDARTARARFNPYKAGKWFVSRGAVGWDDARLNRTLAKNLPARSRDEAHLLTGGID